MSILVAYFKYWSECLNLSSLVFSMASRSDFIFNLESSKSLMVEHLSMLSLVKSEMGKVQMRESNDGTKDDHGGIVTISIGIERIVTILIPIWLIMDPSLFLEVVTAWI